MYFILKFKAAQFVGIGGFLLAKFAHFAFVCLSRIDAGDVGYCRAAAPGNSPTFHYEMAMEPVCLLLVFQNCGFKSNSLVILFWVVRIFGFHGIIISLRHRHL